MRHVPERVRHDRPHELGARIARQLPRRLICENGEAPRAEQDGKERGKFHSPEIDGLGIVVRKSAGDDRIAVIPVHGVAEEGVNPHAESFGIAVRIVQNFRIRGAEGGFRNRFPGAEDFHPPVIVVGALCCDKLDREDVVVLIRVETAAHPGLFLIRKAGDLPRFLPCGIQRRKKHRREARNDRNYD